MSMHPEAERLFALDAALHTEADAVLSRSGLGAILAAGGFRSVGSYQMRTMVWRDLDFEREEAEPSWERHWEVATQAARTGWCVRLQCVNAYREQWADYGFYLGLRVASPERKEATPPGDPSVWKTDIWTARPEEFGWAPRPGEFLPMAPRRAAWAAAMTEEARSHILAIKEAVYTDPAYRKTLLSVHVYDAVLLHGVRGLEEFRRWWQEEYGGGSAGRAV